LPVGPTGLVLPHYCHADPASVELPITVLTELIVKPGRGGR